MTPSLAPNAFGNSEFDTLWRENRKNFATSLVDMQAWTSFARKVEEAKPTVIIAAARRMCRAVQLIRLLDSNLFSNIPAIYSDFAIEFLGSSLGDQDVLIIDDTVNVGSTLKNIWERVDKYRPNSNKCLVMARKNGEIRAYDKSFPVDTICPKDWTDEDYKINLTNLSHALWILNLPLEVEFPVYKYKVDKIFLAELPSLLEKNWPGSTCHRLDIAKASSLGLHRYSIDLDPGNKSINKIRIFTDDLNGELVIAPMAHCWPCGNDVREWRLERYIASMNLFKEYAMRLEVPVDQKPDPKESALLFGDVYPNNIEINFNKTSEYITNFYKYEWPKFRDECLDSVQQSSIDNCFQLFFNKLAHHVEENSSTDYNRLRIGPTFGELQDIINELWEIAPTFSPEGLHVYISEMLDHYIDQGFIVPTLDEKGIRRFRKGEPHPWDEVSLQILQSIGVDANISSDLDSLFSGLSPEKLRRYEEIYKMFQDRMIAFYKNI